MQQAVNFDSIPQQYTDPLRRCFDSVFGSVAPSALSEDADILRLKRIAAGLAAMKPDMEALAGIQAAGLSVIQDRRMALCGIHDFIESANLRECRNIIGSLIERVSTLIGVAHELEDAFDVIGREIAAESDPSDSLRSHMERRDEC